MTLLRVATVDTAQVAFPIDLVALQTERVGEGHNGLEYCSEGVANWKQRTEQNASITPGIGTVNMKRRELRLRQSLIT